MKTNRPHFSWSQYSLWHKSKREFWKRYHLGQEQLSNRYFDKGKEFASYISANVQIGQDQMLKSVSLKVPKLDIFENELLQDFIVEERKIKLLAYLDSTKFDFSEFIEYKTGKIEWTQERVLEHDQLLFYAAAIYLYTGEIPKSTLVWVETMETQNGLQFTGRIEEFVRIFSIPEVNRFLQSIHDTVLDIEAYEYDELEVEDEIVNRYIHLQNVIEQAEQEMAEIKLKIQTKMVINDVSFAKNTKGNFFLQSRKSWGYSSVVEELKQEIAKQQKYEQKENIAQFSVSQFLVFKPNK
jgi:hypothetical protein